MFGDFHGYTIIGTWRAKLFLYSYLSRNVNEFLDMQVLAARTEQLDRLDSDRIHKFKVSLVSWFRHVSYRRINSSVVLTALVSD